MKRIGLYIDVSNLYFCLHNNLKGKLDYSALLKFLEPLGTISIAKAYGAQVKDEASAFIRLLEGLGFQTFYKTPKYYGATHNGKADHDVSIAIDVVKDLPELDMVILATADGDMTPLVEYIKSFNKSIVIIGSNISKELQDTCTKYIEIPSSLVIPIRRRHNGPSSNA